MVSAIFFRLTPLFLITLLFVGCAGQAPAPFPSEPMAKKHYEAGDKLLAEQQYEMAALEYEQSIQTDPGAYISHSKLAVAYYGQKNFDKAAQEFKKSYELWGGASSGPGWAIMQAATLQRAGRMGEAEKLLRSWTGPGIGFTGLGTVYSTGEPFKGFTKTLAKYLLGGIDENSILDKATPQEKPLIYITFAIANAAKGQVDSAKNYLQQAVMVVPSHGWQFALVKAETHNLTSDSGSEKTVDVRPFAQVIYEDCMPVHIIEFKEDGTENPEVAAHYFCKIIAGTCQDSSKDEECKKGISAYDNNRKKSGFSELYKAAEAGNAILAKQLLGIGFNPNSLLGAPGWTPLMIASANGHQEAVVNLLAYGADVNAKNDKDRTPLMFASRYGYDPIVKALLEHGANPNLVPNSEPRWPALIAASFFGHAKTVLLLLEHGADAEARDENGLTAYSWAKKEGRKDVLRVFEEKGITH